MSHLARFVRAVERLNEAAGRVAGWLVLALVATTCAVVALRYGFSLGWAWLQEATVWLHGTAFMLAAGYALAHEAHVRVDVLYRTASRRYRALVDLLGSLLLALPMLGVLAWFAAPYVLASWQRVERSAEAGGLPGLFALKSMLLVFAALLALQALALAGRATLTLPGRPAPPGPPGEATRGEATRSRDPALTDAPP